MTDTNKALEAFKIIRQRLVDIGLGSFDAERLQTIENAISHNAVVIPREEFERVKDILNKSIDYAACEEILAILSQYGEQK